MIFNIAKPSCIARPVVLTFNTLWGWLIDKNKQANNNNNKKQQTNKKEIEIKMYQIEQETNETFWARQSEYLY